MKIFLLALVIFSTAHYSIFSQDFDKVYFNSKWIVTSMDSSTYYRKSDFNTLIPSYDKTVTDFYLINNQVEMTGIYENGYKSGIFNFYYLDGKIKMTAQYNKNERTGNWKEFYQNGILKMSVVYEEGTEKLLALNDSLGNSTIKEGKFKYSLIHYDVPRFSFEIRNLDVDEILQISGAVTNNLRDGKWTIKKGKESYATLTYKAGQLIKGHIIIDNQKMPFLHKEQAFPLIVDPIKFYMTEMFVLDPGAIIKNNYVTEGLHQFKYKSMEKVSITSYEDLEKYLNKHFTLRTSKNYERVKILLEVNNNRIIAFKTEPKISTISEKDLQLVIDTIEKIAFESNATISIDYLVEHEEKIGKH